MHSDIESAFDKVVAPKRKVIEHETDMKMRIGRRETRDRIAERERGKRFGRENFQRALWLSLRPFESSVFRFDLLDKLAGKN